MSWTPRALPASLTRIPTCAASIRVTVAERKIARPTSTTTPMTARRIVRKNPPLSSKDTRCEEAMSIPVASPFVRLPCRRDAKPAEHTGGFLPSKRRLALPLSHLVLDGIQRFHLVAPLDRLNLLLHALRERLVVRRDVDAD